MLEGAVLHRGSEYDRGTRCGKTARRGLHGRCRVTGVPTAEVLEPRIVTLDNNSVSRYYPFMIKGFRCKETEKLFLRQRSTRFPAGVQRAALRKLLLLDAAEKLEDLRIPPGNRLEKLAGNRQGQHSIRINDQRRICFRWSEGDAYEVEIVDYH